MMDEGQFNGTFQMADLLQLATKESEDNVQNLQKKISVDDPVNIVFTSVGVHSFFRKNLFAIVLKGFRKYSEKVCVY